MRVIFKKHLSSIIIQFILLHNSSKLYIYIDYCLVVPKGDRRNYSEFLTIAVKYVIPFSYEIIKYIFPDILVYV